MAQRPPRSSLSTPRGASSATVRLKSFFTIFDDRFEDLRRGSALTTIYRDFSAGLIVALTAIPMSMGMAIASGLRPEQGIIAGAIACLIGRTFGGSKYQVYGPTAAFIPILAAIMAKYDHSFLVLTSLLAGFILLGLGLAGLGRLAKLVPPSIVFGFTIGLALTILRSSGADALGIPSGTAFDRILIEMNPYTAGIALSTFLLCRLLLRISIYIPAPLLAVVIATVAAQLLFPGRGITLVGDRFGAISTDFFHFTPPGLTRVNLPVIVDIAYFTLAIVFISAVESLLCSSMADRLAKNKGTPFNPDREFWGQGWVQCFTPLFNGFPCTGALVRTSVSIKVGAVTPLAGYFKGTLKLLLAFFIAPYLERVPMACIAGLLIWVATNMVDLRDLREQLRHGTAQTALLVYTAFMVAAFDFLTGVASALAIHAVITFANGTTTGRTKGKNNGGYKWKRARVR